MPGRRTPAPDRGPPSRLGRDSAALRRSAAAFAERPCMMVETRRRNERDGAIDGSAARTADVPRSVRRAAPRTRGRPPGQAGAKTMNVRKPLFAAAALAAAYVNTSAAISPAMAQGAEGVADLLCRPQPRQPGRPRRARPAHRRRGAPGLRPISDHRAEMGGDEPRVPRRGHRLGPAARRRPARQPSCEPRCLLSPPEQQGFIGRRRCPNRRLPFSLGVPLPGNREGPGVGRSPIAMSSRVRTHPRPLPACREGRWAQRPANLLTSST